MEAMQAKGLIRHNRVVTTGSALSQVQFRVLVGMYRVLQTLVLEIPVKWVCHILSYTDLKTW